MACDTNGRTDILKGLKGLSFDVESVAHRGDKIQDMADSDGQLEVLSTVLDPKPQ